MTPINGSQGIVLTSGPAPVLAMTLQVVNGMIETVYEVSDPQKLTGVDP